MKASLNPKSTCRTVDNPTKHLSSPPAGTWTAARSPHILATGIDTTIDVQITIEPCAVVQPDADHGITIGPNGALIAAGRSGEPVTIEATKKAKDDGKAWSSIRNDGGTLSLTHVVMRDGGAFQGHVQYSGALRMSGTSSTGAVGTLHVDHVWIAYSRSQGVYIPDDLGFDASSQNLYIYGSTDYPIHVNARVIGSIPTGEYGENLKAEIAISGSRGPVVDAQTMHNRGVPYHVGSGADGGRMDVDSSNLSPNAPTAVLTIEPGVTVRFPPGGELYVRGSTAVTSGTPRARGALIASSPDPTRPIVFTSERDPARAGFPSPAAGDWLGLTIGDPVDSSTVMQNVRVRFAGGARNGGSNSCPYPGTNGINSAAIRIHGLPSGQSITGTEIASSASHGIDRGWRANSQPDFLGNNNKFPGVLPPYCKQTWPSPSMGSCPTPVPCP